MSIYGVKGWYDQKNGICKMKIEENFAEKGEHAGYKHFLLSNKVLNSLHNLSDCEHPMI